MLTFTADILYLGFAKKRFIIIRRIRRRYHVNGDVILAGDFNAKTGTEKDYVTDHMDDHSPVNNIETYHFDYPITRQNTDKHPIDTHGEGLLNLCKNCRMRILNGRTKGDRMGKLTRYPLSLRETPSHGG